MKILVIGEINVDLILQGYQTFPEPGKEVLVEDTHLTLGSSAMICAVGLARLGNQVAFIGKVGPDTWGDFCVNRMREEGIDVARVVRDPGVKTGITVSISSRRDRALVSYTGSAMELRPEEIPANFCEGFAHLHISSFFLHTRLRPSIAALLARARGMGLTTSLDPGFDPAEQWRPDVLEAARECDLFFPNEVELAAITGRPDVEAALHSLQNGRMRTVAKLGAAGSVTLDGSQALRAAAMPVAVVDTTGAGDSYNAGFLHGWLRGWPLAECMRFGAACGALCTLALGGTTNQPTEAQARAFLGGQPPEQTASA